MDNYENYRGLGGPAGMFCVSVFGETHGVRRADIFAALPHSQFGEAPFGQIRALFQVLPTVIENPTMPSEVRNLQRAHFDIVLPHPAVPELRITRLRDASAGTHALIASELTGIVSSKLLPVFLPRSRKYPDARRP
jgi:hypothetical protein